MGKIEDKLNAMGIELPVEPQPIANYVPGVRTGNLLYLSGLGPSDASMVGKVGKDLTKDEGYEAAKSTGIGCIARLKGQVGDLDKVKRNLGDTSGWLVKDYTNGSSCGFKRASVLAGVATAKSSMATAKSTFSAV